MPKMKHHECDQLVPPKRPGLTCLQRAFSDNWRSYENRARSLGMEITHAGGKPSLGLHQG